MGDNDARRASFLIRIWQEKERAPWRIWVQHIPSGESDFPASFEGLRAFFERWMDESQDEADRKGLR